MEQPANSLPTPDFRLLFESSPGLYLVLMPDFVIVAVSDAYLRATMTKREDILGRGLFEIFPDNPDDPAANGVCNLRDSLESVRQTLTSNAMAVQKYDIRRPESEGGGYEERFWSPINTPILAPDGNLAYIIHRVEDVTEFVHLKQQGREQEKFTEHLRTRAEEMETEVYLRAQEVAEANRQLSRANTEMERLYEKTKELDQLKTQFFANVSHELRTPLALIISPTERLIASTRITDDVRRDLGVIARNASLLLNHVNDLLDISKVEAGKMTLRYVEADLAYLVRLTAGHFESLADTRQIRLQIEAEGALRGQVDLEKLQRVLLNLMSNAFKFTPNGGVIRCTLRQEGTNVVLQIADSGPGIPPAYREVVFDRFRQIDGGSTRHHGGTGLGLAIVRDFVELHGGQVSITEAPEGGAMFTLRLPIKAPVDAEIIALPVNTQLLSEAARHASTEFQVFTNTATANSEAGINEEKALVLIVEDNPEMNQFIRESLASEYKIAFALNGKDGLQKALELRPDLIMSDVMMPEMSGDALVREIRSRPEFNLTPILLLTAKADDALRVQLLQEGASDYVMKPFSEAELLVRVRNLVNFKLADQKTRLLNASLMERNQELKQLTTQLERTNQDLEGFSYSVSHDLRAPLRIIDGFSNILLTDHTAQLDAEGQRAVNTILSSTQKMSQLIDQLLDFFRLGRQAIRYELVNMNTVVRSVIEEALKLEPNRSIEINAADLPTAYCDPALIRQVWINLLGNAIKYTRLLPKTRIEIMGKVAKGEVVYEVRDNGAGFDMKDAHRLFGAFQRLHTASQFEGTGVGLALVQRIVQQHEGRVWAKGKVDEGASFGFALPQRP